jgi:hypothetical protein
MKENNQQTGETEENNRNHKFRYWDLILEPLEHKQLR